MSQTKEKKYKQKKKLKSFVWFHIDNNIDKYCSGGEGGRKKKKNPKESTEQVKREKQYTFILSHWCQNPSPHLVPRPPPLPRIPCVAALISGLDDGDPHIPLWSSSFVFLLPISTALTAGAFPFVAVAVVGWWVGFTVGSLSDLFIYS